MAMLNYLGANPAPGLSMPGGMPGAGGASDPFASPAPASPMGQGPSMGAPGGAPMGFGGVGLTDPAGQQYDAVTQEDGSILIHLKKPDGSRGPVVKIVPPIKQRTPGA